MMASPVQSHSKEDGIRDFEEVLEKVRQRNDGPLKHPDPSVISPHMHRSGTPLRTDVTCRPTPEIDSTSNSQNTGHPLIPLILPATGHHDVNQLSTPAHPSLFSAYPIHSTEAANTVNRAMSPFQHQPPFVAMHQWQHPTNNPYGVYPEPAMNINVQSRAPFTGDPGFHRHTVGLYHTMQPWNNIRHCLTSSISSTPSIVFSENKHHVETRPGRSPGCQSTSDSSLQGDTGSGPLPDERKARNRVAAMKCRAKKLEQIRRLEKRVTDLRNLNMDLQRQVISLRGEIQSLHYICLQHRSSGCRI